MATISWSGVAGSSISRNVTIDPSWEGTVNVVAYNSAEGKPVSANLQPTHSQSGTILTVNFAAKATASLSNSTYILIKTGTTIRKNGYLTLTRTDVVNPIPAPTSPTIPDNLSIASIEGLVPALNSKVGNVATINALLIAAGSADQSSIHVRDKDRGGNFFYAATGYTVDNGSVFAAKGGGYWVRERPDGHFNVGWYGADNTAATDSSAAFNATIARAKNFTGVNGGTYRSWIMVPPGWYLLRKTLNMTNANGITMRGMGGNYINSGFIGCTSEADGSGQGIVIDCTGSQLCFIDGITITANVAWGNVASKIGVQEALSEDANGNQLGGLNCKLINCFIDMGDNPTVNEGLGTVGMMNIRSEEFSMQNTIIKANCPVVMSSTCYLGELTNYPLTVTSPYATVAKFAGGSMGQVDFSGQVSLQCWGKVAPAFLGVNVNSIRMHAYIGRLSDGSGTVEHAIELNGQCTGVAYSGTIERFASILKSGGGNKLTMLRLDPIMGLLSNHTSPAIDFTNTHVFDSEIKATYNDTADLIGNRVFVYHAPVNNNNSPATGSIKNSDFYCGEWVSNPAFISPNLLKQSTNITLNTGQPVEKKSNAITSLLNYPISFGAIASGNPDLGANLMRFSKIAKPSGTNAGGFLRATVNGSIVIGDYSTTTRTVVDFTATSILTISANGVPDFSAGHYTIHNHAGSDLSVADITGMVLQIETDEAYGKIRLYLHNSGTGIGMPVTYYGTLDFESELLAEQAMIFI